MPRTDLTDLTDDDDRGGPTYLYESVQFASPVAVATPFTVEGSLVQGRSCHDGPTWWDVQIWGYGSEQAVLAATTGAAPDPGALKSAQRSIPLRARLRYEGDEVDFDIGAGMRVSVYARSINLSVVAITGSVQIRAPGQGGITNPVGAPAPINQQDSLVYGQIGEIEAPIGDRIAKRTDALVVVGAGQTMPIPQRARTLQVFQNTAGGAPPVMNWNSNLLSALDLGQIDFQAGVAPFSTQVLEVPGNATVVNPGAAVRNLFFVWGLEL